MKNKAGKKGSGIIIVILVIAAVGIWMYLTPGKQLGMFASVSSSTFDICQPSALGNQVNLLANYGPNAGAISNIGDCHCGQLSCLNNPSYFPNSYMNWNITCNPTTVGDFSGYNCFANTFGNVSVYGSTYPSSGQITSQFLGRTTTDSPNGAPTLDLLGRRANTCYQNVINVVPGQTYTLSFWFKAKQRAVITDVGMIPSGASYPWFCIWRAANNTAAPDLTSDCEPSQTLLVTDNNWHYYQNTFVVPVGTEEMRLFFYAEGDDSETAAGVAENLYSDLRLVQANLPCTAFTGLSAQSSPTTPTCAQNLQCVNGSTVDKNNCGQAITTNLCSVPINNYNTYNYNNATTNPSTSGSSFLSTKVFSIGGFDITYLTLIILLLIGGAVLYQYKDKLK